jgi:hypothetical protein
MANLTASKRAANPTICPKHQVPYVLFRGYGSDYSMGCEFCVTKIRIDVQKAKAANPTNKQWRKNLAKCSLEDTAMTRSR